MEVLLLFLEHSAVFPLLLALLALVLLLALPRVFLVSRRCTANYRRWMSSLELTEISREDRMLFKGPFFGAPAAGHVVFRSVCKDATGTTRKAFLRCGDHARGLLGHHEIEVRWDD